MLVKKLPNLPKTILKIILIYSSLCSRFGIPVTTFNEIVSDVTNPSDKHLSKLFIIVSIIFKFVFDVLFHIGFWRSTWQQWYSR